MLSGNEEPYDEFNKAVLLLLRKVDSAVHDVSSPRPLSVVDAVSRIIASHCELICRSIHGSRPPGMSTTVVMSELNAGMATRKSGAGQLSGAIVSQLENCFELFKLRIHHVISGTLKGCVELLKRCMHQVVLGLR